MQSQVTILPSGKTFPCEGNSTLLEAGLRHGLALGYGCSNGNCGECVAKVVSGQVRKVSHHDYVISAEKRMSGHVLMCCNTAATDLVLEAPEAHGSAEIPQQELTARVRNIEIVSGDVALLHLKTPRTQRLRFLAGQQVRLECEGVDPVAYPIGSCPCDDMNLHFQLPRLPDDAFSEHVFTRLGKGDQVKITGPVGDFVLDEDSSRPLVFIAWHTGFAPVRSLVEHAMALDFAGSIQLAWITRAAHDRYQDNLCRSWQDAFDNFQYLPLDADPRDGSINTASVLGSLNIDPKNREKYAFYVAGDTVFTGIFEQNPGWSFMTTPSAAG